MSPIMEQRDALYGVSPEELVHWCGINRTTAARWKRGESRAPLAALRLAELRITGDAQVLLGSDWRGWSFGRRDGLLYAPGYRSGFSPGEILALPYLRAALRVARGEARLDVQLPFDTDQPILDRIETVAHG